MVQGPRVVTPGAAPVVASPGHVRDPLLVRLLELPAGTDASHAFDLLIDSGAAPLVGDDTRLLVKKRLGARLSRALGKGWFPEGHILFSYKQGAVQARNQEIEQHVLHHMEAVGRQSVRAVYYALLGKKVVGHERNDYQKLDILMVKMRENGLLDPDLIIDETSTYDGFTWGASSLDEYLDRYEDYDFDPWTDQPVRVEVWIEKATLGPLLASTFREHRVRWLPTHGNLHFGTAHQIAREILQREQPVRVLWLGDFDPSGLNICDVDGAGVIRDRMHERLQALGGNPQLFTIKRIGLTKADITAKDVAPLWVPIKDQESAARQGKARGDANAQRYAGQHGNRCWEVDALASRPDALRARVARAIIAHRDEDAWDASLEHEATDQAWVKRRVLRMRRDAERRS
jgi:hypothetical protein